ncbi:hypothetical protein [Paracoccus sp. ME4]|uniref:hypothetical protein n=1 Tax=Paracoccus sp. ME4 TaxID=3138066 RepID=UPI00398A6BFC
MTKITGAQFKDFYQNHWPGKPGEVWHEDSEYEIEDEQGRWILPLDAILETNRLGYLHYDRTNETRDFDTVWEEFVSERRGDMILTLRVPAGKLEGLRAALSELGISPIEEGLDTHPAPGDDREGEGPAV